MRLPGVQRGESFKDRFFFGFLRIVSGHPAPDVLRLLRFRPERFGKPFSEHVQQVLRGPSSWTVGEREAIATYVSNRNRCLF